MLYLVTQAAKKLGDTSVPGIYPAVFAMVSDILDDFGNMVFLRIKERAEEPSARDPFSLRLQGSFVKHNFKEPLKNFDMEKSGFWTGTIILTDEINDYEKIPEWCYEKLLEYAPKLYLPDQEIFNIMLEAFNLEPMGIDKNLYCAHPIKKESKNAIIVHAYRPKKFWDCFRIKEWVENDKIWKKMGGSAYKGKIYPIHVRFLEKLLPGSPDPLKKPRPFIKYLCLNIFDSPYKNLETKIDL